MDPAPFSLDRAVTAERLAAIRTNLGLPDDAQPSCQQVCTAEQGGFGLDSITQCALTLPSSATATDGNVHCAGTAVPICEGRRELAHEPWRAAGDGPGAHLASMAYLEAASVAAFLELAADLERFDAPVALVRRCRAAAADERKHAAALTAVAGWFGAAVPAPTAAPVRRPLREVALHNAVEGCVHETWAALVARRRASTAAAWGLGALFAEIADDEARHAQLAWDVHACLVEKLQVADPAGAGVVEAAQRHALASLPAIARGQADLPAPLGPFDGEAATAVAADLARRLAA